MMANVKMTEADTPAEELFQCCLLSMLWALLLQIFFGRIRFPLPLTEYFCEKSDWESEKVFQQHRRIRRKILTLRYVLQLR